MLKAIVAKFFAALGRAGYGLAPDRQAVPTIEVATSPTVPTPRPDAMPMLVVGTSVGIGLAPSTADYRRLPFGRRSLKPEHAATAFLDWLRTQGQVGRPWPVRDVWMLASLKFAVASNIAMPPRKPFLGALQRLDGVSVQYDKRIWLDGRKVKTTVYTFTSARVDTSALQAECGPATPARIHDRRAA